MEDGQSIVIQDVPSASGFKSNVLSVSLLGRRGVSAELGADPCLRKGDTKIMIHERPGLYIADLYRVVARKAAETYATVDDNVDTPRSYATPRS